MFNWVRYCCLWFLFVSSTLGCGGNSNLTKVIREVNACWSDDEQSVLLVESHYKTSDLSEPYFSASSSREWQVVLHEAKVDGSALKKVKELFRWTEESQPGQTLQYHPIYWLRSKSRVVGMIGSRPFLLNLDAKHASFGKRILLRPSDDILLKFAKKDEMIGFSARSPAPSPNGEFVGVFYTFAYQPSGGTRFDIAYTHIMSFFRSDNGQHIQSLSLKWPDKTIDPQLKPPAPITKHKYSFLWKPDSSGVLILDRKRAFFISATKETKEKVKQVPSIALQTKGGLVSSSGLYLEFVESGNKGTIRPRSVQGWVAFEKIPLVSQGSESFSVTVD